MKDQGESSRKKIRSTLQGMIEQFGVDTPSKPGFTVSQLLSAAGISRGTFYAYYSNLEDAFEDLTMEFSNQIVERMRRGRKEMTGLEGYRQGYLHILELVYAHQALFKVIFHQKKLEKKFLETQIEFLYQQYLTEFPDEDPEHLRFTAISNTYFIFGMLLEWEKNGFEKTPEEMAALFGSAMGISKRLYSLF